MKGRLGQIFGKLKRLKNQGIAGTYDRENTDVWSKGTSPKCMYYQVYNIYMIRHLTQDILTPRRSTVKVALVMGGRLCSPID